MLFFCSFHVPRSFVIIALWSFTRTNLQLPLKARFNYFAATVLKNVNRLYFLAKWFTRMYEAAKLFVHEATLSFPRWTFSGLSKYILRSYFLYLSAPSRCKLLSQIFFHLLLHEVFCSTFYTFEGCFAVGLRHIIACMHELFAQCMQVRWRMEKNEI